LVAGWREEAQTTFIGLPVWAGGTKLPSAQILGKQEQSMSQVHAALQASSLAVTQMIAQLSGSVVAVHSHRARSSGFVWRPGLIVTAEEALAEDGTIEVTVPGGNRYAASLVGRDPSTDVALLRVSDMALPALKLVAAPVETGAFALAVGAREGAPVASLGIVAYAGAAWRSLRGGEIAARIELDLRLQREAEGGVALDATGAVFGMAVFGPQRRVLVIPAVTVDRVAALLAANGRIARGYLGLGLQQVRLAEGGFGLMVMTVDPNGPAAAAQIRQGDVLLAHDGRSLSGPQELQALLGPSGVGTVITLSISRGGQPVEAALTIAARGQA
jgi:S1-C subfamily serine protease